MVAREAASVEYIIRGIVPAAAIPVADVDARARGDRPAPPPPAAPISADHASRRLSSVRPPPRPDVRGERPHMSESRSKSRACFCDTVFTVYIGVYTIDKCVTHRDPVRDRDPRPRPAHQAGTRHVSGKATRSPFLPTHAPPAAAPDPTGATARAYVSVERNFYTSDPLRS